MVKKGRKKPQKRPPMRSIDDSSYTYVQHFVRGYIPEIESFGYALYLILASHTEIGKEYTWISRPTMAKELSADRRTVNRFLKKLQGTKPPLIRIEKRPGTSDMTYLLRVKPKTPPSSGVETTSNAETTSNVETAPSSGVEAPPSPDAVGRRTIKNNHIKKKHTPAKRGIEGVDVSLFDDDTDKLNKAKLKNSFEYKSSITLAKAVKTPQAKRIHPIQRKPNILEWSKEFRNLHVKDGIEKNTIEYILDWYCLHIGEEHIPEAFSGESFREKFAQIISAMIRAGDFDKEDCGQLSSEDDEDDDEDDERRQPIPEPKTHVTKSELKVTRTFKRNVMDGSLTCRDVWTDKNGKPQRMGHYIDSGDDPYEFNDDYYDDYEPPEPDED